MFTSPMVAPLNRKELEMKNVMENGRPSMRNTWRAWGLAIVLAGSMPALADVFSDLSVDMPDAGTSDVDRFYGSFGAQVPVDVPAYHGLEPHVGLNYRSSLRNGIAGIGWDLDATSVIERASPGKGAPNFDGRDIWLLDGQELFPCPAGSVSPSCTTGGTHSTKQESYARIRHETDGTWTITGKNGTVSRYTTTFSQSPTISACGSVPGTVNISGSYNAADNLLVCGVRGDGNKITVMKSEGDGVCNVPDVAFPVSGMRVSGGIQTNGYPDCNEYGTCWIYFNEIGQLFINNGLFGATDGWGNQVGGMRAYGADPVIAANGPNYPFYDGISTSGNTLTFHGYIAKTFAFSPHPKYTCSATGTGTEITQYHLSSRTDSHGNAVNYQYWTDGASTYLGDIRYNGHQIHFHYEGRPDPVATLRSVLDAKIRYRLRGIEVKTGTATVRGYALTYAGQHPFGLSTLSRVQQYGKDVVFSTSGAVTSGSALPAFDFGYSKETPGLALQPPWPQASTFCANGRIELGDFNGDGKTDLICDPTGTGTYWITHAIGPGNFSGSVVWPSSGSACVGGKVRYGDFNGDGKTDMLCSSNAGTHWVGVSNGNGGFDIKPSWPASGAWCNGATLGLLDVNGDGKEDLHCMSSTGQHTFAQSRGDGSFVSGGTWPSTGWCEIGQISYGDFNGDGKGDLLCREESRLSVSLSTGDSLFTTKPVWPAAGAWCAGDSATVAVGDYDGDGKDDLRCFSGGKLTIAFSRGGGTFAPAPTWPANDGSWCAGHTPNSGDYDGDGRTDLRCSFGGTTYTIVSVGDGTFLTQDVLTSWCNERDGTLLDGDFNADGMADLYCYSKVLGQHWTAWRSSPVSGYLTSITTPLGGSSTIEYAPASQWPLRTPCPTGYSCRPPSERVVSAVSLNDGRGQIATTRFSYGSPLIDPIERRFLGFRNVRKTLPCNVGETPCPYEDSLFLQDYGSISKPERIDSRSGSGTLLRSTVFQYVNNGSTVPYTSHLQNQWDYSYEGATGACPGAGCKRTRMSYVYDRFGNVVRKDDHGDADVAGDERSEVTDYLPNATKYIVALPVAERVYRSVNTVLAATDVIAETRYAYDQPNVASPNFAAIPSKGDRTHVYRWVDRLGSYTVEKAIHDAYGNVTTAIDASGRAEATEYDATFHVFPVRKTNALNQVTTAAWDTTCGKQKEAIGLNGAAERTVSTFDVFCRPSRIDAPGGNYTKYGFANIGNPASQAITVASPSADGVVEQSTSFQFDGLGRVRTEQTLASGSRYIVKKSEYHPRGQIRSVEVPHYSNEAASGTTSHAYDALDRLTTTLLPNGKSRRIAYGLWYASVTDELSRVTRVDQDARGNKVSETYMIGSSWHTDRYAYDLLGRQTRAVDAEGNVWQRAYDSLGRLYEDKDPDRGRWVYAYFADGRMSAQDDARGAHTDFVYDAIGRMKTKSSRAAGQATATIVSNFYYDEPRAGFYNNGRLSRHVDNSGSTEIDHDVAGRQVRLKKTISGQTTPYTFEYGYDAGGLKKWTRYPDGEMVGSTTTPLKYDAAGRPVSIPGFVSDAQYNAAGNPLQITFPNGVATTYGYFPDLSLKTITTAKAGGATLQSLSYARDGGNRISAITSSVPGESWSYTYDNRDRLVTAGNMTDASLTQGFSYSPSGNLLTNSKLAGSYVYPAPGATAVRPHAMTQVAGGSVAYDQNGNVTARSGIAYGWDGANRLSTLSAGGTSFLYDAFDQRVRKTSALGTSVYPAPDYRVRNGVVTKNITFGGMLVAKRQGGTTTWLHGNHQGSISVLTNTSGLEIKRLNRAPFGVRNKDTVPSQEEENDFISERRDEEGGLVYQHSRYYDPVLARYLSPDNAAPGTLGVGFSRYAYAMNDPINKIDDGHAAFEYILARRGMTFEMSAGYSTGVLTALMNPVDGIGGYRFNMAAQTFDSSGRWSPELGTSVSVSASSFLVPLLSSDRKYGLFDPANVFAVLFGRADVGASMKFASIHDASSNSLSVGAYRGRSGVNFGMTDTGRPFLGISRTFPFAGTGVDVAVEGSSKSQWYWRDIYGDDRFHGEALTSPAMIQAGYDALRFECTYCGSAPTYGTGYGGDSSGWGMNGGLGGWDAWGGWGGGGLDWGYGSSQSAYRNWMSAIRWDYLEQ